MPIDAGSAESEEETGTGTGTGTGTKKGDLRLDPMGLALAEQMFLSRSNRQEIIDGAYNRYANRDEGLDLPEWFLEDEEKHSFMILPVTKQQVCVCRMYRVPNSIPLRCVARLSTTESARRRSTIDQSKRS